MSSKGKSKLPTQNDIIEDEELATHQETVPIPMMSGTRIIALRWISPALDKIARQAKQDRPGKKG